MKGLIEASGDSDGADGLVAVQFNTGGHEKMHRCNTTMSVLLSLFVVVLVNAAAFEPSSSH